MRARPLVDEGDALRAYPKLAADRLRVQALRPQIDCRARRLPTS